MIHMLSASSRRIGLVALFAVVALGAIAGSGAAGVPDPRNS
jgi:hypothetical protein